MDKKGILLTIFLIFLVMPLSSSFNASSDVYSIGSYSMGSAENRLEGVDLTGRGALSYQQGAGGATSTIYSLNLGGSKQLSTPSEELTTPEVTPTTSSSGGSGGRTGSGCAPGYKKIGLKCVKVAEEVERIPSQLFDISLSLDDFTIQNSDDLSAVVTFESFGTVPTLVDLTFIVLDEFGNEIYREGESITVITEEILRKSFEGLDLPKGKYTLILNTLYNIDVFDEFRQDFEIGPEKKEVNIWVWIIIGIFIGILIIGLILWLIRERKKEKKRKKREKEIFKKLRKEVGHL